MNRFFKTASAFLAIAAVACEPQNAEKNDDSGEVSVIQERSPEYSEASLVYYGGDEEIGSDWWTLTLYTDMEVTGGYPIGPGQMISISFNASRASDQTPDTGNIIGTYTEQSNTGDFSAGTFVPGSENSVDMPGGAVTMPMDTFFGDIAEGETDFEPKYIMEGDFSIEDNGDGTWTVSAIFVDHRYMKHYVYYRGALDPVDRSSGSGEDIPNSNLTSDLELTTLTRAQLVDYGASYGEPVDLKEPYRKFLLYLAEDGVDLTSEWASGTGKLLRIELFVSKSTDVEDGLPQGEYTMAPDAGNGGILSTDILPFRIIQGYPDKFTFNTGSWYQEMTEGTWVNYARITGGSINVTRDGDAHDIVINLTDCSEPAHTITCRWQSTEPIPSVNRDYN